jgi:hypothetical protein
VGPIHTFAFCSSANPPFCRNAKACFFSSSIEIQQSDCDSRRKRRRIVLHTNDSKLLLFEPATVGAIPPILDHGWRAHSIKWPCETEARTKSTETGGNMTTSDLPGKTTNIGQTIVGGGIAIALMVISVITAGVVLYTWIVR